MNSKSISAYSHLTSSVNGKVSFGNGLKMVWGVMNSSVLQRDTSVGGYSYTITLSSYGLSEPVWACISPRYAAGFPKVAIASISRTGIKIASDVGGQSTYYIHWFVIG